MKKETLVILLILSLIMTGCNNPKPFNGNNSDINKNALGVIEVANEKNTEETENENEKHTIAIVDKKADDGTYLYVGPLHENRAIVMAKDGLYYHIDKNGNRMYEKGYDDVSDYKDGIAIATKNEKMFHIGLNGERLYKEEYELVHEFFEGYAVVTNNPHTHGNSSFHINKKGERLYEENYQSVGDFHEGRAWLDTTKEWENESIFIDLNGEQIGQKFRNARDFQDGRAWIEVGTSKFYLIDLGGNRMGNETYVTVSEFHEGINAVRTRNECFHIDMDGNRLYKQTYGQVDDFHEGAAYVCEDTGKKPTTCFHINKQGERIYEKNYGKDYYVGNTDYKDGIVVISDKDRKYYFLDKEGKPLFDRELTYATPFSEGFAAVRDDSGWYHIDMKGNPLYEERYDKIGSFSEGAAAVMKKTGEKEQIGFHVDTNGKPLYEERYGKVESYIEGYAIAYDKSGGFHIDKNGKPIYEKRYGDLEPFEKGMAQAGNGCGYIKIDINGRIIRRKNIACPTIN